MHGFLCFISFHISFSKSSRRRSIEGRASGGIHSEGKYSPGVNSLAFLLPAILRCRFLGDGGYPLDDSIHVVDVGVVALLAHGSAPVPV
jgi:hypothetical protein